MRDVVIIKMWRLDPGELSFRGHARGVHCFVSAHVKLVLCRRTTMNAYVVQKYSCSSRRDRIESSDDSISIDPSASCLVVALFYGMGGLALYAT